MTPQPIAVTAILPHEVYPEYFPHRPAKTTVEISQLDKDAQIEVEVVAAARDK